MKQWYFLDNQIFSYVYLFLQELLKELEEFAFKGIPDVRGCRTQDATILEESVSHWYTYTKIMCEILPPYFRQTFILKPAGSEYNLTITVILLAVLECVKMYIIYSV